MNLTSTYKKHFFLPNVSLETTSSSNAYNTAVNCISVIKETAKKSFDFTRNIVWVCSKCGHTHIGVNSPSACPICNSTYHIKE